MLKAALELLAEVGFETMSIKAIASRAGVGKTTIYRRYSSKAELVADAIESMREEVLIPDTGTLWGDMDTVIENAAQITLTPLGRQTVAMIISSASSNPGLLKFTGRNIYNPDDKPSLLLSNGQKQETKFQQT